MAIRQTVLCLAAVAIGLAPCMMPATPSAWSAEQKTDVKLIPVAPHVTGERKAAVIRSAPAGRKLLAYLDCGSQIVSDEAGDVRVTWKPGEVYRFASEAKDVPATQATVVFDKSRIVFEVGGLDRTKKYEACLTWWDYDDRGRTQMVTTRSPDGHQVQLAVAAIRLPNFTSDHQRPGEKRFRLPVNLAVNGKLQIVVDQVTGANAVVSEVWVWQVD